MLYSLPWAGVEPTTSVLIGTDDIDSCKSNYILYYSITEMTAPSKKCIIKLGNLESEYYNTQSARYNITATSRHILLI